MGTRREGREAAVQFLYQRDLNQREPRDAGLNLRDIRELRAQSTLAGEEKRAATADAGSSSVAEALEAFWALRPTPASKKVRDFGMDIAQGVLSHQAEIDERIQGAASHYELHRLAAVDRNILRVAVYELLFCPGLPPAISINEAIEIAKRYGTDESGRFVNGVLDRIRNDARKR
jgi:N utilization substance protein B